MIHQAGHSTWAAKSGQSGPVHQGDGGGLRDVLGGLFPAAPAPVPRWSWRLLIAFAEVLAACLGAVVLLLRVPGRPWDSLYAEDYYLYFPQALQNPWHLLSGWEGYLQLGTRLVVQLVTCLPLADAAKGAAVSGALVAACCALFIFHASAGHIRSVTLRVLLAAAVILLSSAPVEIADSDVNLVWYLLPALFWAVLWRPPAGAGMTVAGLVGFFAAATSSLAVLFAPLLAIRLFVLRRPRDNAVTAGWLAGCLLQVPFVVSAAIAGQSRLVGAGGPAFGRYNRWDDWLLFSLHDVVLRSVGWHLSWWLQSHTTTDWATLIVGIALAAALGVAVKTQRAARPFLVAAGSTGLVVVMSSLILTPWYVTRPVTGQGELAARYTALPILLIEASLIVAADCALHGRRGTSPRHPVGQRYAPAAARPALAATLLIAFLAGNWAADFRYPSGRSGISAHQWAPTAAAWQRDCQVMRARAISATLYHHDYTIPCDHIRFASPVRTAPFPG
jgi:hypothetical protein